MPQPRFDLIISDIDGCLQPESSDPLDIPSLALVADHNIRARRDADRPLLTLCSGRPQPFAEALARLLRINSTPLISENGVWLFDLDRNHAEMDPDILPHHLDAVREASAWVRAEYGHRSVSLQPGKVASLSLYHEDTPYLRSIMPRVAEEFARRALPFRVSMTWLYINCDLTHVSKGTGLDRLMRRTGHTRDRLAGIGDTMGDLPIRERVAFFACPANAAPEIKAHADYVSPYEEAKGVVDIIQRVSED